MSKTKTNKEFQVFEYEGKRITFDFGDGDEMVNASHIVTVFEGKRLRNFIRLQQTKDFIKALEKSMNTAKGSDVSVWKKAIKSVRGGKDPSLRGIWYEKRLALKLAAWLNPEFEVWIFSRIDELLRTGQSSIKPDNKIELNKKELEFYLNKIFDNTLQANQLSKFLLEKNQLSENENE